MIQLSDGERQLGVLLYVTENNSVGARSNNFVKSSVDDSGSAVVDVADNWDTGAELHPLLAVEAEPGRMDERRSLVSSASWQREQFLSGNVVDAMALIRRSAWEKVGGYTHIEGGWEDFDFWCKLVEAGYHGVQCPRILALYRSHAESMSHRATNRSWHALSRTLQKRHPWLRLRLAQTENSL